MNAGPRPVDPPSREGREEIETLEVTRRRLPPGPVRRLLTTWRHFLGLALGGLASHLRSLPRLQRRRLRVALLRFLIFWPGLLVDRKLKKKPLPVQLRVRFERLGPTYIKLGQILSLREDLLPREVTEELKNLLDRLPAVPFEQVEEQLEAELGCPIKEVFTYVHPRPLGSASIGQTHLATTHDGRRVLLKVVKPGIRELLQVDTLLLRMFGGLLELFLARFQPRRILREFCDYTLREADLVLEADNAETFAANFGDLPEVVFPKVFREHSTRNLLCMEYIEGIKPDDPRVMTLAREDRERLVDLGAEAIIRMLYRDGFFHADLHPGNLLILPGPRCAFIDLGMVGRFDEDLKRSLLYYYYCLVMGDAESAARYLAGLAQSGPGSDPKGFRRDVEDICRRWSRGPSFHDFSLGQLVMRSVAKGGQYRMYFPVEMVLMVKALVTFEGVGQILLPGFDVAQVSKRHINRILLERFAPLKVARESLRGAPELLDSLVKVPMLISEGLRLLEQSTRGPAENPFAGLRGTLFGGFCLVAGAIFAAFGGPWPIWALLLTVGLLLPLRRGS